MSGFLKNLTNNIFGLIGLIILSPIILAIFLISLPFMLVASCITAIAACFHDKNNNKTLSLPIELEILNKDYVDKIDSGKINSLHESIAALNNNEKLNIKDLKQVKHTLKDINQDLKHNSSKEQYKHLLFTGKKLTKIMEPALQAPVGRSLRA